VFRGGEIYIKRRGKTDIFRFFENSDILVLQLSIERPPKSPAQVFPVNPAGQSMTLAQSGRHLGRRCRWPPVDHINSAGISRYG
jgi:hypothetical protein